MGCSEAFLVTQSQWWLAAASRHPEQGEKAAAAVKKKEAVKTCWRRSPRWARWRRAPLPAALSAILASTALLL